MDLAVKFMELGCAVVENDRRVSAGDDMFPGNPPQLSETEALKQILDKFEALEACILVNRLKVPAHPPGQKLRLDLMVPMAVVAYLCIIRESPCTPSALARIASSFGDAKSMAARVETMKIITGLLVDGVLVLDDERLRLSPPVQRWLGNGDDGGLALGLSADAVRQARQKRGLKDSGKCSESALPDYSAKQIFKKISERVIGQHDAVKAVSVCGALHLQTARATSSGKKESGSSAGGLGNAVLCFAGESGVGKTWLAEIYGQVCGLPFSSMSACDLSETGFVGLDPENLIKGIVTASGGNLQLARHGIGFLDELDKRPSSDDAFGRSSLGVQHAILKMLEGTDLVLNEKRFSREPPIRISTRGMLFIVGGVFAGLRKDLEKQHGGHSAIGFADCPSRTAAYIHESLERSCGMVRELANRITHVIRFRTPDSADMRTLLLSQILPAYKELLSPLYIEFSMTESAIRAVAEHGLASRAYCRGMRMLMARLVEDMVFDASPGNVVRISGKEVARAAESMFNDAPARTEDVKPDRSERQPVRM